MKELDKIVINDNTGFDGREINVKDPRIGLSEIRSWPEIDNY